MGILEKLRPQPRWKHADPAVRAAAVYDLGPDEGDALRALAREDAEARVRRAAVTRLDDVAIARRHRAHRSGRGRPRRGHRAAWPASAPKPRDAVAGHRGGAPADRAAAGCKEVVVIARESSHAGRARRASSICSTTRSRSARSAATPATAPPALRALARLHRRRGAAERRAQVRAHRRRGGGARARRRHRGAGGDRAARPQQGGGAARAHEAAADRGGGRAGRRSAGGADVRRGSRSARRRCCSAPRRSSRWPIRTRPTAALAASRLAWAELRRRRRDRRGARRSSSKSASEAVREAIAERQQERAAEEERAEAAGARAGRSPARSCRRSRSSSGAGAAGSDRRAARCSWDALPPMPSEYAASLTRRFQDACRAFEDRERRRMLAQAAAGPARDAGDRARAARRVGSAASRKSSRAGAACGATPTCCASTPPANPEAAERLERADCRRSRRRSSSTSRSARKQEQDNLRRLQQLCRQVETLAAAEQITLKAGDRALRDIRAALDERGCRCRRRRIGRRSRRGSRRRAPCSAPRVQELRDADEWQRWANLQVQEELCQEMEALKAEDRTSRRPAAACASCRGAGSRWRWRRARRARRCGAGSRRRRTRCSRARRRTSPRRTRSGRQNLAQKQALCERAEALADSTDWVKTATAIQALQAEWKTIGPVSARQREGDLGALPRRLRSLLHAAARRT